MHITRRCGALLYLFACAPAYAASTSLISVSDDTGNPGGKGGKTPSIDGAGDIVAFASASNELQDELYELVAGNPPISLWLCTGDQIYVRDMNTGAQSLITRDFYNLTNLCANGDSRWPSMDPTGRYVAWMSSSTNLTGDPASTVNEVFRVDLSNAGLLHRMTNTYSGINRDPDVASTGAVAYQRGSDSSAASDTNGFPDIYLAINTAREVRVSVPSLAAFGPSGASSNPAISGDGNFVVYESYASNLVSADFNQATDVFLRDLRNYSNSRLSDAPGADQLLADSFDADISFDGRWVVFSSEATNLIPGDVWVGGSQVFLLDRQTGTFTRMSKTLSSLGMNSPARPSIAPSGDYAVFEASTGPGLRHLLRFDRHTGSLAIVASLSGGSGPAPTYAISNDGRKVVFDHTGVVLGLSGTGQEAYLTTLTPGVLSVVSATPTVDETASSVDVSISRSNGADGAIDAHLVVERATEPQAAAPGHDFGSYSAAKGYLLSWDHRDAAAKTVTIPIINDERSEGHEMFRLRLIDATGDAVIAAPGLVDVTIADDD